MKKLILIISSLVALNLMSSNIMTILDRTINIDDSMSMTIQIKESDGPVLIPEHTHPFTGTVYLIKGKVDVEIEGKVESYREGQSWIEPKDKLHSGQSKGPIKYFVVYHHSTGKPYTN